MSDGIAAFTKFPDGQISVEVNKDFPQDITARINSYEDLFKLRATAQVYNKYLRILNITIPCLFGQRSDRSFSSHGSFDLKLICDIINDCQADRVNIFDPHSDVAPALINNCFVITPEAAINDAIRYGFGMYDSISSDKFVLVSPDAGAYKKVFKFATDHNYPLVAANKYRQVNGDITINFSMDVSGKTCLIVDDLADGGYTFSVLGGRLKEYGANKVYLYVSHGFFHAGFDLLKKNIDGIVTTDSVWPANHFNNEPLVHTLRRFS